MTIVTTVAPVHHQRASPPGGVVMDRRFLSATQHPGEEIGEGLDEGDDPPDRSLNDVAAHAVQPLITPPQYDAAPSRTNPERGPAVPPNFRRDAPPALERG